MKLHARIIGEPGTPLIILHGFLGSGDNWKTLGNAYAAAGYHTHLIDARNHGRSPHDDVHDYDAMASDVAQYLDDHNLDRVHLIGHSMGGKTAMTFMGQHPGRVAQPIIADIAPRYYPPHHQVIIDALLSVDLDIATTRQDVDDQLARHIDDVGIRMFLMKSLYRVDRMKFGWRFNLDVLQDVQDTIGTAQDYGTYDEPVLFIRGGASNYIQDSDWEKIVHAFAKAELETIPNVGHWLHAEAPEQFLEHSLKFLRS